MGHVRRYALGRLLLVGSAGLGLLFLADVSLDLPGPVRILHLVLLFGALGYKMFRSLCPCLIFAAQLVHEMFVSF